MISKGFCLLIQTTVDFLLSILCVRVFVASSVYWLVLKGSLLTVGSY